MTRARSKQGELAEGSHRNRRTDGRILEMRRFAAILAVALLSACSYVQGAADALESFPDKVNGWIGGGQDDTAGAAPQGTDQGAVPQQASSQGSGGDTGAMPQLGTTQRPVVPSNSARQQAMNSLVTDRNNAQASQADLQRMGDPTRPLNGEMPPAPQPVSQGPVPQAVPQAMPQAMPAPAAVGAAARPAAPGGVQATYRQRLAEFDRGVAPPQTQMASMDSMPPPATNVPNLVGPGDAAPPQARASSARANPAARSASRSSAVKTVRGVHPLGNFNDARAAASFEVASIDFGAGSDALPPDGESRLRDVASLYKSNGGVIRIAGRAITAIFSVGANSGADQANRKLAADRAQATAAALVRLGVPAGKIYAGPAQNLHGFAGDSTEIFIDY